MQIESLRLSLLAIPFRTPFRHASAERSTGCSLWVEARSRDGAVGYGEGCPRDYVTGETLAGAAAFAARHERDWRASIHDLASLRDWTTRHCRDIDSNPATWAAVELALLELMAQEQGIPVERLLGLAPVEGQFRYTAVLGDASAPVFAAQLARYQQAGLRDFKLKLSGDFARDLAKVRALKDAGVAPERVRADANNLWHGADTARLHLDGLRYRFCAVEEPLRAGDLAGMRELARAWGARLILDESLLRAEQLQKLCADPGRWVVNLRVSKLGGLLRALEVLGGARALGIPVVVGAHVGESSLLTRAALPLAQAGAGSLLGQEGAFGTHLLVEEVCTAPLMFGAGGRLAVDGLAAKPGWGLAINAPPQHLQPLH